MVGFYALALGVAAFLFLVPWLGWKLHLTNFLFGKLALFSVVAGAIVLWSILPRPDRFEPPGPRLLAGETPRAVRRRSPTSPRPPAAVPQEVYLVPDVNAWVGAARRDHGLRKPPR